MLSLGSAMLRTIILYAVALAAAALLLNWLEYRYLARSARTAGARPGLSGVQSAR